MQQISSTVPELLSRQQAAKVLNISERKLDYLREDHLIPFVRIGKKILFMPADLEEFVEARKVE